MNPDDIPTSPLDRILLAIFGDDARDVLGLAPDHDDEPKLRLVTDAQATKHDNDDHAGTR